MALKVIGQIELSLEELLPVINKFVLETHKLPVEKVEISNGKIVVTVNHELNKAMPFERLWETPGAETRRKVLSGELTDPNQIFKRKWNGLYSSVGLIIDSQRKRKKKFISFEDIRAELLEMKDHKGEKMFIKNGEELPMYVLKQRLATSQIPRQAKTQPNLKGVRNDKKRNGLSFS